MENKELKIVFSILHYQSAEMTKRCVEAIRNLEENNISIVIVDNKSPNGSGKLLKKMYGEKEHIHVLLGKENHGFAKGNNIGYQYAKKELGADIIVVMNNDVLIQQENFVSILREICSSDCKKNILGPDIVTMGGIHQNPMRRNRITVKQILWMYLYCLVMTVLLRIPGINNFVIAVLNIKRNRKEAQPGKEGAGAGQENIVLQGSIIIFSKSYVEQEEFAFIPDTFMFGEEDILYEYAMKRGYSLSYEPNLKVLHLQHVSLNKASKNEIEKKKFCVKCKLDSLCILCRYRFGNRKNGEIYK